MLILLRNRGSVVEAMAYEGAGSPRRLGAVVALPADQASEILRLAFAGGGLVPTRRELSRCHHEPLHPVLRARIVRKGVDRSDLRNGSVGPAK